MEVIDRMLKNKFDKADVIVIGYNDNILDGTLTSIAEDEDAWVTYKDSKRFSKRGRHSRDVYFDTPENRKIVKEINELSEKQKKMEKETDQKIVDLKNSMTTPLPKKE